MNREITESVPLGYSETGPTTKGTTENALKK